MALATTCSGATLKRRPRFNGLWLTTPQSLPILLTHLAPMLRLELGLRGFPLAPILVDRLTLAVLRESRGLFVGTGR